MQYIPIFFLIIVFAAVFFLSRRWKRCEPVDQGFALCYWKLSYRRKLIRTLWLIPVAMITLFCFHTKVQSYFWTCLLAAAFAILLLIQAIYNYKKWKKEGPISQRGEKL